MSAERFTAVETPARGLVVDHRWGEQVVGITAPGNAAKAAALWAKVIREQERRRYTAAARANVELEALLVGEPDYDPATDDGYPVQHYLDADLRAALDEKRESVR